MQVVGFRMMPPVIMHINPFVRFLVFDCSSSLNVEAIQSTKCVEGYMVVSCLLLVTIRVVTTMDIIDVFVTPINNYDQLFLKKQPANETLSYVFPGRLRPQSTICNPCRPKSTNAVDNKAHSELCCFSQSGVS